jgi:hypothetical protein
MSFPMLCVGNLPTPAAFHAPIGRIAPYWPIQTIISKRRGTKLAGVSHIYRDSTPRTICGRCGVNSLLDVGVEKHIESNVRLCVYDAKTICIECHQGLAPRWPH